MSKGCLSYQDYTRDREGLKPVFDEAVRSRRVGHPLCRDRGC